MAEGNREKIEMRITISRIKALKLAFIAQISNFSLNQLLNIIISQYLDRLKFNTPEFNQKFNEELSKIENKEE